MTRKKCKQCENDSCFLLWTVTFSEKRNRKQLIENNNIDEELCCICNRLKGKIGYQDCCRICRSSISTGNIYGNYGWEGQIEFFASTILKMLIERPLTSIEIRNRIAGDTNFIDRAIKKLYRNGKIKMIKQGRKYPYALVEGVYSKNHFKFVDRLPTNNKQLSKQKEGDIT